MADFVELRPGMRLMIPSPDGVLSGYYHSAVRRIDGRGLLIDIPRLDGSDLELRSGQTLTMYVQLHGRLYHFESRIRAVDLQVLLDEPGEAHHTERRAFFRLMLTIPGEVVRRPDPEADPVTEKVTILDLSGGGARIRTDAEFPSNEELELTVTIDGKLLRIGAQVVRAVATERGRGGLRYEAHLMFTNIRRNDQDAIVRFVFLKQREFSQRGVA